MPASVLLALAIFPLADWIIWDLARMWIRHGGEGLRSAWPPATDEEKIAASRFEAVVFLFFYALIISGILLLIRQQPILPEQLGFRADRWTAGLIFGVVVGMAWVSIPDLLAALVSKLPGIKQPLRRPVWGVHASWDLQLTILFVGAFTEELWRALCLVSMMSVGYSSSYAVTASSIAFSLARRRWGTGAMVLAALEGALFGGLFLWQRSLIAPFTAHLVLNTSRLLFLGDILTTSNARGGLKPRGMVCPFCRSKLVFSDVGGVFFLDRAYAHVFPCSTCQALIGVPRRYRYSVMAVFVVCFFAAWWYLVWILSPVSPEFWGLLLAPLIGWWAALTLVQLVPLVWPPKPKPGGDPEFITLNIGGGRPPGV